MIMCVLLCYPLSIRIYYQQGVLFLVETSFSYDKDVWIAVTDYYMHCYIIMLFPLTAILQLINFTASYFLVY